MTELTVTDASAEPIVLPPPAFSPAALAVLESVRGLPWRLLGEESYSAIRTKQSFGRLWWRTARTKVCPVCAAANQKLGKAVWSYHFRDANEKAGLGLSPSDVDDIAWAADNPRCPLRPALLSALGMT